ncbi:MAG TPA: DUF4349 domain-containing protein [Solirubrobacteraceae bacterium]|nr:DUF4349 domain-containing protein [Solirubrobacteraceae bacterium]
MRRAEPLEPEVEAALEAIDATLAGEPVDPEHAELAELSLILQAERPAVPESFAATMDARVGDRFGSGAERTSALRLVWRRLWRPGFGPGWLAPAGAMAAVVAVIVVLVSVTGGGGGSRPLSFSAANAGSASSSAGGSAGAKAASTAHGSNQLSPSQPKAPAAPVPRNPLGRQIVQGARLSLSTRPSRIGSISQRVFAVIGSEKGYVASSSVTATGHPDSSATFALSVPSSNLQETLTRLSQLPGASVVSSTITSRDITGAVGGAGRRLAEARALRRSLLQQLASAYTTDQINALKARIARVDKTIDRDNAALTTLHRRVRYSRIELTLQGSTPPVGHRHGNGGGFTLGRAVHDAVHVLVIAAGVLLIALAVAIPVGLVAALVSWLWLRARRKAREAALDRV